MQIRLATLEDYEAVMELYNGFVGEDRYSQHDNDSFKQVIASPMSHLYVAAIDGKLIGFASMSMRRVVRYPKPIAELDELYVDPAGREHGVGKHLMEQIETAAKDADCHRMYISSHYKHEAAHKFYENLGYTNNGYHFIKNL